MKRSQQARYRIGLWGRRTGKTVFMRSKYCLLQCVVGKKIGLFAPNFKDVEETWVAVCESVETAGAQIDNSKHIIRMPSGGVIDFWSLANKGKQDAGRGRDYDIVVYEETQSISSNVLEYSFTEVVKATLLDRQGICYFFGTPPPSRRHYFYKLISWGAHGTSMEQDDDIVPLRPEEQDRVSSYITIRLTAYDNPHVSNEAIEELKSEMAPKVFDREIMGKCIEFSESPFILELDTIKGQQRIFTTGLTLDKTRPVWISFDFNKTPMPATMWQFGQGNMWIKAFQEFGSGEKKVNIHYTCRLIREYFEREHNVKIGLHDGVNYGTPPWLQIYITGDATGNTSDPRQKKNLTFYEIILQELGLPNSRLRVPSSNPAHENSWAQMNSFFSLHHNLKIDEQKCPNLRADLIQMQTDENGKLNKKVYDPHFGDTARYVFNVALPSKWTTLK